jgi:signal transduction histidine kinase
MAFSIRHRLLAIAMLGVVACILAVYALGWPLGMGSRQRLARAQDGIEHELARLTANPPPPASAPSVRFEGPMELHSGAIDDDQFPDGQSVGGRKASAMVRDALMRSRVTAGTVVLDTQIPDGILAVGARPVGPGRSIWAVNFLRPPRWSPVTNYVAIMLGIVSLVLVAATVHAVVSVQRGAASLKRSLVALGQDLSAPVPRPSIGELREVADGIAVLAGDLSRAQVALAERERLAVLGRVSAGIAHEIRNPLASIKLQVDLVCREKAAPPETIAKLGDVLEEIARLDRLVNDLLTVAVRRTGPREETALADLVRRRAALMEHAAKGRGVRVVVEGEAVAKIDADAVSRVIDNLVRNAIEASPEGAKVAVEVTSDSDRAYVRVRDSGPGVSSAHREELFQPFFTTKPDGVGLGLALARGITAAHGGALGYERDGATTMFELSLPSEAKQT